MLTRSGCNYPIPKRLPREQQDTKEYKDFKKTKAAQIHGIYEETMLEVFVPSLDLDAMAASGKFEPSAQLRPKPKRRGGRPARKPRVKPRATVGRKRRSR